MAAALGNDIDQALNIELVNTGSELMLGRVLNTHQHWLCRQLADRGYLVSRQVAVADTAADIAQVVREALGRAQVVMVTGGLGPTSDDLTRDAIASLFGLGLREDALIRARIEAWFTGRKRPMPASVLVQALVPEGAKVLPNAHGTAPGLLLEADPNPFSNAPGPAWLIMLPGPPRELRPMFSAEVLPLLEQRWGVDSGYTSRTLRTTGIGESMVEEAIAPGLAALVQRGLEVGYCARPGEVDVRLAARGAAAAALTGEAEQIVRRRVGACIFGVETEPLEAVVVHLLTERRETLVAAESCTGGRLSSRITDVPGASLVFLGGLVTYSNALKQDLLGVRAATLETHGAVSEATAREMAEGARSRYRADFALGITGIAGPDGGSKDKPVGTVFIALAAASRTVVVRQNNSFDRETFKQVTSQQALEMLRRELLGQQGCLA